jgi:copper chaperone CopZ
MAGCAEHKGESPPTDSMSAASFNASASPTVAFSVPDMICPEGCAVAVKELLARQPGVKEVFVDFDAKTATVAIEEGQFNAERALAALVDKQFDNSTLKSGTSTQH